ncbi:restriction endonuclease subunit S, partial [Bifidobacterium adolescentis]|nr:restriction endonuclease subunit S [Bifidobacterium adolescentis]
SVAEQASIGAFFDRLDSLITLHQRKYDKLCVLKKSMLDKMFPKGGSLYPEIRFAGFTDPWEQRKLGELYKEVSEKNDLTYGRDRIISVAHMYFNPVVYVTEDDYLKTYNVMRLGDIAFEGNRSKNFAHGRLVENTIGDGIVSHVFKVFRPIRPFDLMYWKYSINNEKAMKDVLTRSTKASTMMHELVAKDFLNEEIAVPSLEEQRQIGAFFDRLDSLITLHQRKLELLRNIKKSMLDKMFV